MSRVQVSISLARSKVLRVAYTLCVRNIELRSQVEAALIACQVEVINRHFVSSVILSECIHSQHI